MRKIIIIICAIVLLLLVGCTTQPEAISTQESAETVSQEIQVVIEYTDDASSIPQLTELPKTPVPTPEITETPIPTDEPTSTPEPTAAPIAYVAP